MIVSSFSPAQAVRRAALVVMLFTATQVQAQYTASFKTNTISATTSNWTGASYIVGDTFTADGLVIQKGGILSNALGYLGFTSAASNNVAIVQDAGSMWRNVNQSALYIGYASGGNRLVVTNGGVVVNYDGFLGYTGGSNLAVIAGPGSVWSNTHNLTVGYNGSFNQLIISNGASVYNEVAWVGQNAAASRSNSVLVTGTNSQWISNNNLYLGQSGAFSRLTVSNGARVVNSSGYIGENTSSSNNTALIADRGSIWSNSSDLVIGHNSRGNSLMVSNGGTVFNVNGVIGGENSVATNNAVTVTGAHSLWFNQGTLSVGGSGGGNRLTINDGAVVFNSAVDGGSSLIGGITSDDSSSANNQVTVSGAGSIWSNQNDLAVGFAGSFNRLIVTNSGVVHSQNSFIGALGTSGNNTALVAGTGSTWNNAGDLQVGAGGSNNGLVISNQGVVNNNAGYIGHQDGGGSYGNDNRALVTGAGSVWNNRATLSAGSFGTGNQLVISNNASVFSSGGVIGDDINSANNQVIVTGSGSTWNNKGDLLVGNYGSANQLNITAGGAIAATSLFIGYNPDSVDNAVTVDAGYLTVTNAAAAVLDVRSGSLALRNGGSITTDRLVLTNGTSSVFSFNGGQLNSGGTMATNAAAFIIGDTGGNSSFLAHGGVHNFANDLVVGNASDNNSLLLTNGAVLNASGNTLFVGMGGSANQVTVSADSSATVDSVVIGALAFSIGNHLLVAGGNLLATNAARTGLVDVGQGTLTLNNGGSVTTDHFFLTNGVSSIFVFSSGTLNTSASSVSNNRLATVGDGVHAATWNMNGGVHSLDVGVAVSQGAVVNVSSAILAVSGLITNNGTMNFANSVARFHQTVVNLGAWITDPTTNILEGDFIQADAGYVHADAGDVYIFTNNAATAGGFLNHSTNNLAGDTSRAKFIFDSTLGVTQDFHAAGHELLNYLDPGIHTDQTSRVTGDWTSSTNVNFSLGTLEIASHSSVNVWDAFSALGSQSGTNDDRRAALYVTDLVLGSGSILIIGSNTSVYFLNSNAWTSANFVLLGGGFGTGGELHQFASIPAALAFVPEPQVLLYWGIGLIVLHGARRRSAARRRTSPERK